MAISGTLAFVGDGAQLVVADISDPTNPVSLGSVAVSGEVNGIAVEGDHAYLVGVGDAIAIGIVNVEDGGIRSHRTVIENNKVLRCGGVGHQAPGSIEQGNSLRLCGIEGCPRKLEVVRVDFEDAACR